MKIEINNDFNRIILSIIFLILSFIFKSIDWVFILISYVIVSIDLYKEAFEHIKEKEFFDEDFLMIIATLGAFYIGEYVEGLLVMLLFQIGEYLSDMAVDKSRRTITDLLDLRSDIVHLKKGELVVDKDLEEVKEGDVFVVKPGERIPLDGKVVSGSGFLDTSSLTGESVPREVREGDEVLSGCICNDSKIVIEATSDYKSSTASRIMDLIENSNIKKTKTEKFITRFSKIYTPCICGIALLILIILLIMGYNFNYCLYKALIFLVISCPCALVISVPLGFFMGIGRSSKEGVIVKGSSELENLTKVRTVVFDKTGTLTKGVFEVGDIVGEDISIEELLELVAYAEYYSNHPISKSIIKKYNKDIDKKRISDFKEKSGKGIDVKIDGKEVIVGTYDHLKSHGIELTKVESIGTNIYVSRDLQYLGCIVVSDIIKEDSYGIVENLEEVGVSRVIVLSGDNERVVEAVCSKLGIKEFYANLLPIDKVKKIEEIKKDSYTAFVGDGINDAPVIKIVDEGISMGGIGSDATIEASDIVLMKDNPNSLVTAIKIADMTKKIVIYNIVLALLIKVIVLILGVIGISSILMAVLADVGVTLLTIINTFIIMKREIR